MATNRLKDIQSRDEKEKKLILREYRKLLRYLKESINNNPSKRRMLRQAFIMAADAHKDMRRKSGEPYILHPLEVAQIVVKEIGLGVTSAIGALLHDTVEDTEVTLEEIEAEFSKKVSNIVDGLTKISNIGDMSDTTSQAENFKKILITLADDPRVILIKIADRLHNMRTLDSMKREKQLKIASETQYVYAPLAHRLGLYNIKTELEDLSMKYLQSEEYNEIKSKLKQSEKQRKKYISEFIKPIKKLLKENNIDSQVFGRVKAISSIYNKMRKKHVSYEEVFDIFAIRIIFHSEDEKSEAWKIYSYITDIYQPRADRLRDWLTQPKSNGYEALHTTVLGPGGRWVEVQIRSSRMDKIAEQGLAAHWRYKDGVKQKGDNSLDSWLTKIREQLEDPNRNSLDFLQEFKLNLFNKEIYVYSPKGELKVLPMGATVLDFAFEIHTELGRKCIGAKINFKLAPLNQKLKSGDQIEIITSQKQKPSENWISIVQTSKAKSSIKNYFKEEKKIKALEGEKVLRKKLEHLKIPITDKNLKILTDMFRQTSLQDLYSMIAEEKIDLNIEGKYELKAGEIKPKKQSPIPRKSSIPNKTLNLDSELIIFGERSSQIKSSIAKCCQPVPGDDVFGFITMNEGVKIHRTNCPNAPSLLARYGHRIVKTKWQNDSDVSFLSGLLIRGTDDVGLIQKITNIISLDMQLNMQSISVDSVEGIFEGKLIVYISNKEQIEELAKKLMRIPGIIEATRIDNDEELV